MITIQPYMYMYVYMYIVLVLSVFVVGPENQPEEANERAPTAAFRSEEIIPAVAYENARAANQRPAKTKK